MVKQAAANEEKRGMQQAFVLVGGKGTRLGALTAQTPKPLLPIDGERVFLDYVLAHLARQGVTDIVLLAGQFADQVVARYDAAAIGRARVSVVREPTPAGTAGALTHAAHLLGPSFFLLNGDCLFDIDLAPLAAALGEDDVGALALRRVEDSARYGLVDFADGRVSAFSEKDPARVGAGLINGGIYALRRPVMDRIKALPCSIETDVFPRLAAERKLGGREFDGYFLDIGLPETLEQARRELPARFAHLFA